MTGETGFLLLQCIENPVTFGMDLVTGCTGHAFTLMRAAEPGRPGAESMTAQAYLVLLGHRCRRAGTERYRRVTISTPAFGARMFFSGAVAGFALKI